MVVTDKITLIALDDASEMRQNPLFFDMQIQAVKLYCRAKLKSNPKTTLGLSVMRPACFDLISKPTSDIDSVRYCLQGQRPYCGLYDFYNGLVNIVLSGFLRHFDAERILVFVGGHPGCDKAGMESLGSWLKKAGTAVDVVWFPDMDPRSNTKDLYLTPLKKERVEAFFAAANNNNNSHIAYLEPGLNVRQVLTESGILPPRLLSNKDKEKAAVIDGPENVIPMKMKNHHQTSSSGLAQEDETASDVPQSVVTNSNNNNDDNKKNKHKRPPFKTSHSDNKGKNQVC